MRPAVGMLVLLLGCGQAPADVPGDPLEGGILTFDAAMLGGRDGASDARGDARARDAPATPDARIDEASDTRLFVPEFQNTYGGPMADPGFEVIAHTLRTTGLRTEFLVAIQNTFDLRICGLLLETTFFDAAGVEMDRIEGFVRTPAHRRVSGFRTFVTSCLGPGQIGMMSALLNLGTRGPDEIARASWVTTGFVGTDTLPTTDIAITDLITVPEDSILGGLHFSGRFENRSEETLMYPEGAIFGVNAVGRPLFESRFLEETSVVVGGSVAFETFPPFEETFATYVAFPDAFF
jgi:hypothetical protein